MTAPDPQFPLIEALDLRPAIGETTDLEFVWDWPPPPAVSIDENRSEPPPSRVSAARS